MAKSTFSKKVNDMSDGAQVAQPLPVINLENKPGLIGRFKISSAQSSAITKLNLNAIAAVFKEANATTIAVAESQGENTRLEHTRINAQVRAAIGNELITNSSAAHQTIGTTRMVAAITGIEAREEWKTACFDAQQKLGFSDQDREALLALANDVHAELEDSNDKTYNAIRNAIAREYNNACSTANEINNRA